jgi:hypothetical protein
MKELTETKNTHAKQNHDKSGKKAQRKELRRLEAIARQVERVEKAEKNALKAKNKADAYRKVNHAKMTLLQIRGGKPHNQMVIPPSTTEPTVAAGK